MRKSKSAQLAISLLLSALLFCSASRAAEYTIRADIETGPLNHFWRGTGFTPGSQLLDEDMQQQLIFYGAVPHKDLLYIRPHGLLDFVETSGWETGSPAADFSQLDLALDQFVNNGLKPFFEIMGRPGRYFANLQQADAKRMEHFQQFVSMLATHLVERYGRDEVQSWYFETWNEPDLTGWTPDFDTYLRYYNACVAGLKSVSPKIRMGGPGNALTNSAAYRMLLMHSVYNYLGDAPGPALDFVSVHEKGGEFWFRKWPDSALIVRDAAEGFRFIELNTPELRSVPFINNEADPLTGWRTPRPWRAGPWYPAFIAKVINMQQLELVEKLGVNYVLHHNDHAGLGPWEHQTLFARLKNDNGFALIKKPVHAGREMMSLLGDRLLHCTDRNRPFANLGIIPSKNSATGQISILIYNSVDDWTTTGTTHVTIHLQNIPFTSAAFTRYAIDAEHTNPYAYYQQIGSPEVPTPEQLQKLRDLQELALYEEPKQIEIPNGKLDYELNQPLPGLTLLLLTPKAAASPDKPTGLAARTFTGLQSPEIVLKWKPSTSYNLHTYIIESAPSAEGPWQRVNTPDIISSAYLLPTPQTPMRYRVRALDYFNQPSPPSEPISIAAPTQ